MNKLDGKTVSICITAYNVKKYIARCVKSILAQTYPNWELIIVDNGSVDGTFDEIQKFATSDSRIKPFKIDNNRGFSGGCQFALDRISGDFYMFIDADDWIEPKCLEISLDNIEKFKADILTFRFRFYYGDGKYKNDRFSGQKVNILTSTDEILCANFEGSSNFYKDWAGVHWGKLFRTSAMTRSDGKVIERGYNDFKIGFCEDNLYTTKCCLAAKKYVFIDEILYDLNREGNSTTVCKTKNDAFIETFLASELIFNIIPKNDCVLRAWSNMFSYFVIGQYLTCGDRKFARKELKTIKNSPIFLTMKKYAHGFKRKTQIKLAFGFPGLYRFLFVVRHPDRA